jgi:hypothetical protein
MSSKTPPADRSIAVTILPTNDAPTLPKNRTVVVGHYIFRDTAGLYKLKCSRPITRKRPVTTFGSYIT